jgi:hypothetical protein
MRPYCGSAAVVDEPHMMVVPSVLYDDPHMMVCPLGSVIEEPHMIV